MPKTPAQVWAAVIRNLSEKTGKSLDDEARPAAARPRSGRVNDTVVELSASPSVCTLRDRR